MATIKYFLRGSKDVKSISLAFSIDRRNKYERKTGLVIQQKQWSKDKALPKQTLAENKKIASELLKLKSHVLDAYNESLSKNQPISSEWLQKQIDIFFDRITQIGKSPMVIKAIQSLIDNAEVRENQKGGFGLSNSRKNDYRALKRIWEEFEGKIQVKVSEVDIAMGKAFLSFMLKKKNYSIGYAQRMMGNLKTVCYDAGLNGIKTSPQLKQINLKQIKNDYIIYLTPLELEKIKTAHLIHEGQINARKWLLLGCWIGQRGNDLLSLTNSNLKEVDGFKYFEIKQQKTAKTVTIPILPEAEEILELGWPRKISLAKFNEHIKTISEKAGIDEPTKGILNDPKTNRKKLGTHPKWKLLASHVCRRSYCSNLYGKIPTPIIMQVTGHSTEKSFLKYIGKKGTDYKDEWIKYIEVQKQKASKESNLIVVREAIK
ncbi:phage integrase SAM-like domain-containing protein [Allomuricauda sp. XS_ASV26]|uniref:phage integrase SAM-like domain-containing protein n=1 Tax=Allomuricauda sp. XS_ASV26 TaxID=3241292 RepID=UPI003517F385